MPVKRLLEHLECERAIDEAHRATDAPGGWRHHRPCSLIIGPARRPPPRARPPPVADGVTEGRMPVCRCELHPATRFWASMASAKPAAPRAITSTARRDRRVVETLTDDCCFERATWLVPKLRWTTSSSPASAETARSVGRSAIPPNTTVVRTVKGSIGLPSQRRRAGQVLEAGKRDETLARAFITIAGRSGSGEILATSSSAKSTGATGPTRSRIGGVAQLGKQSHHEGSEQLLLASARADVQRVGAATERVCVEVGAGSTRAR